jgi:hypothetical protein
MFEINLVKKVGYDAKSLFIMQKALTIIENVVNSVVFKEKVLGFPFYFRDSIFIGYDTHYSNDEVYAMIMNAIENPGNVKFGSMDLYLHLIEGSCNGAIGYGNPNEKEIYTCKLMLEIKEPKQIANHIIHEWTRKLGFTCSKYNTRYSNKAYAVPYAIGNIIEELADVIQETKTDEHLMAS